MSQQFLNRPYVATVFEQVGGKRMSKRVACRAFVYAALVDRGFDGSGQPGRMCVMSAKALVVIDKGVLAGRKKVLPFPIE